MAPKYNIDKIKFSVDDGTYSRGLKLYESGKVVSFKNDGYGSYQAKVEGTHLYRVSVSSKQFNLGSCDCYLGQRNILCKHMIAVAISALAKNNDGNLNFVQDNELKTSSQLAELTKDQLVDKRRQINMAIRLIKYYTGTSKTWFAYQNSLEEGCNRLRSLFSSLPISPQTCSLVLASLIKIDKKLMNGVDDSDGIVGRLMREAVDLLIEFVDKDPNCFDCLERTVSLETCFDWQQPLAKLYQQKK